MDERGVTFSSAESPILPAECNQPFRPCRQGFPGLLAPATRRITPHLPAHQAAALILPPANELQPHQAQSGRPEWNDVIFTYSIATIHGDVNSLTTASHAGLFLC